MSSYSKKISILVPTFNHEKYIKYFIESVLSQTEQDFELIIIDDCSTDNTIAEIEAFNDKRIKLYKHDFNMGINATLTDLIKFANSNILAISASDDILMPNYIEEVLKIFNKNKNTSVVYVSLKYMDEFNELKNEGLILNENEDKFEILKKHFLYENCLPSPGMAFKKEVIEKYLPFPTGLIQYSDWQLHNNLLLDNEVSFTSKQLIGYRVNNQNSASARCNVVLKRESLETPLLMEPYLKIKNVNLFKKIFNGLYEEYGEPTNETIPYFLGLIALKSPNKDKQRWGYSTIIRFVSEGNNLKLLNKLYGIDFAYIIKFADKCNIDVNYESNSNNIHTYINFIRIIILVLIFIILFIFMRIF